MCSTGVHLVGGTLSRSETRLYTVLTVDCLLVLVTCVPKHISCVYIHTMENLMDSLQKRIFNLLESGTL